MSESRYDLLAAIVLMIMFCGAELYIAKAFMN